MTDMGSQHGPKSLQQGTELGTEKMHVNGLLITCIGLKAALESIAVVGMCAVFICADVLFGSFVSKLQEHCTSLDHEELELPM